MVDGSSMTLRFLGSGGAFSRQYGTTCSLVTFPGGERWLIDCGRQAPDQLWDAGLDWHEIDGQIVTHVHGDHIFGLEDFAFQRYYQASGEVSAIMCGGPRPRFLAHSAVRDEVWESLAASLRYLKVGDNPRAGTFDSYFEMIEPHAWEQPGQNPWRHSETFTLNGHQIVARESEHVPGKPSCSLEIEVGQGDRIAWWSGDCTVDAGFLAAIEPRTTIYFHDCTFTDYPGQVHGAFSLLEKLPKSVRDKMVLMHHEDDIEDHRAQVEALGFRVGLPDQVYDLVTGRRVD
ncbi:MBL fold metallo-hydrolase [Enhygromyxa salina]|uniref:MBL fold metallo-hydrolase n=1 Tax=Enhygromyxa salina TaxID=215803 RepID=UPI0015E5FF0D|nr:MBL fold metallo-hydrolase [Enhygromyxa salina]